MAELRELARVEGKAWASRLRKQLQAWNRPANDNFPGRIEEAAMLAVHLSRDPLTQRALALIIQAEARAEWCSLKGRSNSR